MYSLIIAEKPSAAKKIAESLADGKPIQQKLGQVSYYMVTHGKEDIVVVPAVGHLYSLAQKSGKKSEYPVFDIEWRESSEVSKKSEFSNKYLSAIKKLSKKAGEVIVACDYDQEGSVIGLNIVRYACKAKDGKRMKFSTLTKDDLLDAYKNKSKTLDWAQAEAGESRHFLDWYNGINYSRALTNSIKAAGSFKLMSTGRVQGPALKIIVEREKEIKAFKPVPFWQISLNGEIKDTQIEAWHKVDKFWEKEKSDDIYNKVKNEKKGIISQVEKNQFNHSPPVPFDLTSLQIEAYRTLRIQPKTTLEIAQELYTSGYISYPRTSSQQYPPQINLKKIMAAIAKNPNYKKLAGILLENPLIPNNGKKTDPAHPAIYPTGEMPSGLNDHEIKLYDLIVRRFLSVFGKNAIRETMQIDIDVKAEVFITKGTRTVEKGWHIYYEPYLKLEEQTLPNVTKEDIVDIKKFAFHTKETQPPKRYTPASIIKELEKRTLGTKATRANIIETLYHRGYIHGTSVEATDLGIKTIETLEKYCPKIIDEELSRHFEIEMDQIIEGNKKGKDVLEEAKKDLIEILSQFKKEEKSIGIELIAANKETRNVLTTLGQCPNCKVGDLQIRKGKFGSFAACNKYPDCKTTFSLPSNALIKPAKKLCETCNYPMVTAIKRAKKPMDFCLNPKCPTKHVEGKAGEEAKALAKGDIEKKCPECKEGNLVLRGSIYGKFYGCSNYPKCKYIKKLENNPLDNQ